MQRYLRQWESPPTWLLAFAGLAWAQARYLPLVPAGPIFAAVGAGLIAGGLTLILLAAWQFRRHRTTIFPREAPQNIITTGIYRFSRNPIYLGDGLILTGIILRADLAGLVLVPLFVWIITLRFIAGEEAGLRAKFAVGFGEYAARVRRWL